MSFGESVFSVGFIQKTVKGDQFDKFNRTYPQRKQPQKVLEDSRGHRTEAEAQYINFQMFYTGGTIH
jgi:hypothetical protein